jgi:hypothetical protein
VTFEDVKKIFAAARITVVLLDDVRNRAMTEHRDAQAP